MMIRLLALSIALGLFSSRAYTQPSDERTFFSIGGALTNGTLLNKPKSPHSSGYFTMHMSDITTVTPFSFAYYTPRNIAIYTDFSILNAADSGDSIWQASLAKEFGSRFYDTGSSDYMGGRLTKAYQFRTGVGYRKSVKYWHFAPKLLIGLISSNTSVDQILLKERNTNIYYDARFEEKPSQTSLLTLSPTFTIGFKPGNKVFRFNLEMGYSWITGASRHQSTLTNLLDKTTVMRLERQRINGHYLTIGGGISWDISKRISKKKVSKL